MKKERKVEPLLFSRKDCADALGCGLSKIDSIISSGELKSFLWRGDRKIHSRDLWNYAWSLRNDGTKQTDLGV